MLMIHVTQMLESQRSSRMCSFIIKHLQLAQLFTRSYFRQARSTLTEMSCMAQIHQCYNIWIDFLDWVDAQWLN